VVEPARATLFDDEAENDFAIAELREAREASAALGVGAARVGAGAAEDVDVPPFDEAGYHEGRCGGRRVNPHYHQPEKAVLPGGDFKGRWQRDRVAVVERERVEFPLGLGGEREADAREHAAAADDEGVRHTATSSFVPRCRRLMRISWLSPNSCQRYPSRTASA
jgi:hypothetical protein